MFQTPKAGMKICFVYAGRQGSNLECALALYGIAKEMGHDARLVLSEDNGRKKPVEKLYPQAQFFNFLSPSHMLKLGKELEGGIAFFTMLSPKIMPLLLSVRAKRIFYFHATYDYSYEKGGLAGKYFEMLHKIALKSADVVVATQHPLAWQIRAQTGVEAQVLSHPPYSTVKGGFFAQEEKVKLPFAKGEYFLNFGEIGRASKGTDVLLRAAKNSELKIVLAGKHAGVEAGENVFHLNRWVSDGELYYLVKNCRAVVLPYLLSSQFSGCLALAYHFKKPVVAPFSAAFEKDVEDRKSGLFFSQGDWKDLEAKMLFIQRGKIKFSAGGIGRKEKEMEMRTRKELAQLLNAAAQ